MHRGYFALWRKFEDHEFWKERRIFSKAEAWIDLLWQTRHTDDTENVIIGMTIVKCEYGQTVKSLTTWADRWRWSPAKVRRFLKLLEKMGQIVLENVTVTTRITVCNFEKYDPKRNGYESQSKSKRIASESQVKTNKNDKNVKNDNKRICVTKFSAPSWEEFNAFCIEKGFGGIAKRAYDYYSTADWKDSKGQQVKNWKSKLIAVWFRDENKTYQQPSQPKNPAHVKWRG